MLEKINELNNAIEAINKKRIETAKELRPVFGSLFKELFDNYPNFTKLSWTQYTPYFNDGDVCEFSVNGYAAYLSNDDQYAHPGEYEGRHFHDDSTCEKYEWARERNEKLKQAGVDKFFFEKIDFIWKQIPESLFQEMFGDGFKITVNRDEVIVEEYHHD